MTSNYVHLLRVAAEVAQTWQDLGAANPGAELGAKICGAELPAITPPLLSLWPLFRRPPALASSSACAAGRHSPTSPPPRAQPAGSRRPPILRARSLAAARRPRTRPALAAPNRRRAPCRRSSPPTSTRLRASPSASTCFGCHQRGRMDQVAGEGGLLTPTVSLRWREGPSTTSPGITFEPGYIVIWFQL